MSRIEVRIRSLVVHGARSFAADVFSTALCGEIEDRVGIANTTNDLAGRFRTDPRARPAGPDEAPPRDTRFEAMAAARVARRLSP